jgi:hypothetical protein
MCGKGMDYIPIVWEWPGSDPGVIKAFLDREVDFERFGHQNRMVFQNRIYKMFIKN